MMLRAKVIHLPAWCLKLLGPFRPSMKPFKVVILSLPLWKQKKTASGQLKYLLMRIGITKMRLFIFFICIPVFFSCNSEYVARPRGYFKIPLPPKKYQLFDKPGFPYSFEYPVYGQIVQDSLFFEQKPENPYWINIDFP